MLITLAGVHHSTDDFDLDPLAVEGLWKMEDAHFWHAARNQWIRRALAESNVQSGARILDVGCGSGSVALALHSWGYRVTGIDTAEVLVRKADTRCPQATFVCGNVGDLPADYGPFDAIGFFDVLEHLSDPISLMRQAFTYAKSGCVVLATVPALRRLYSVIDQLAGHKKRYEPGELAGLFRAAGLSEITERGIFRSIAPLLGHRRTDRPATGQPIAAEERRRLLREDTRIPMFPLNALLRWLCRAEIALAFKSAAGRAGPTLLASGRLI